MNHERKDVKTQLYKGNAIDENESSKKRGDKDPTLEKEEKKLN